MDSSILGPLIHSSNYTLLILANAKGIIVELKLEHPAACVEWVFGAGRSTNKQMCAIQIGEWAGPIADH